MFMQRLKIPDKHVSAASICWTVESSDFKLAFDKGNEIQRDVFIKPPP